MAKQEELEEENQKRLRQNNILIHGKIENESATDDSDVEFVNALLKEICVGAVKAKFMVRIGKKEDNRPRPLKLTFHNESDNGNFAACVSLSGWLTFKESKAADVPLFFR